MNNTYNPDSHLANYSPNDPICPLCKKAVKPQHSKSTDPVTKKPCHDYCLRVKADREFVKAFTPNKYGEYA